LASAGVQVEHAHLQTGVFFGAGFVHLLDHLERQYDVADLAALPVPDQLHLALVLEQQKAVLFRQGFVRLQKADDLLLFLFRQSWHKNPLLPVYPPRTMFQKPLGFTIGSDDRDAISNRSASPVTRTSAFPATAEARTHLSSASRIGNG